MEDRWAGAAGTLEQSPPCAETSEERHVSVLIVDDSAPIRKQIRAMLKLSEAITVVGEASDGSEALRLIGELQPDFVLLDLQMPGTDGLGVLSRLRGRSDAPTVIVLTCFSDALYRRRALELGAAEFLDKSTESERLVEILEAPREGAA